MKKIILFVFVSMLSFSNPKIKFYNIDKKSIDSSSQVGIGMHYSGLSLEAIYEKKLDSSQLEEKELKEYFRNGNVIGFNVNYNMGEIAKRPTIKLLHTGKKNNIDLFSTNKKTQYKLIETKNETVYSYSTGKIINSGNIILKGNVKSENELMKQQIKRVTRILKKNSKRLLDIYGEIKGINVEMNNKNSARYINSNKVVLYFK